MMLDYVPDYRLIAAVVQQLPRSAEWTQKQRDRWLLLMTACVDLMLDVVEEEVGAGDEASAREETDR